MQDCKQQSRGAKEHETRPRNFPNEDNVFHCCMCKAGYKGEMPPHPSHFWSRFPGLSSYIALKCPRCPSSILSHDQI
jgi:hypothetical protein